MDKQTELIPMEFISSYGALYVMEDGSVDEFRSDEYPIDSDCWLVEIEKVDIQELDNYYKIQGLNPCQGGDVLDFGWWDKKGNYNKPDTEWRLDVFHNTTLNRKEVEKYVEMSFQWIDDNRKKEVISA